MIMMIMVKTLKIKSVVMMTVKRKEKAEICAPATFWFVKISTQNPVKTPRNGLKMP